MFTFYIAIIFVLGSCIGWFIGILVYRLPRRIPLLSSPTCDYCNSKLKSKYQIPILGYIFSLRRCSNCFRKIPFHYFLIEIITPILLISLFLKFGFSLQYYLYSLLTILCITIFFTDLFDRIVPDILTIPFVAMGILFSFWNNLGFIESIKGSSFGGAIFFIIAILYKRITKKEGLGRGDIKLMAMIGSFLGFKLTFLTIFLSSFLGMIIVLISKHYNKMFIPFGSYIVVATYLSILIGNQIIETYLKLWRI
ncbi:MAG: prepilin peptidase [Candidatus Cloacimonetes bacterium]|nr:prepilin peptidase [Candidatus Cloacimonadota bacterium]